MSKAYFDQLFDNLKTILEEYSASEPEEYQFIVCADRIRDLPSSSSVAYVIMHMGQINPKKQSIHNAIDMDVQYHFDMLVKAFGSRNTVYPSSSAEYIAASEAAGIRYRYLCSQLLYALFPQDNLDYSLGNNVIGERTLSSIQPLPPEALGEKGLAAGRLTINVSVEWKPTPRTGTELESINVTADKWSALYEL